VGAKSERQPHLIPLTDRQARYLTLALAALALWLCLKIELLGALLAGLLVHELVHTIAPGFAFTGGGSSRGRLFAIGLLGVLIIGVLVAAAFGILAVLRTEGASPAALLARLADILDGLRGKVPAWIADNLPADAETLGAAIADWLRHHATDLQHAGRSFGAAMAHALIGMVIGAIICLREARGDGGRTPFLAEGAQRVRQLAASFRGVVFAQVKISAVNTVLTGIYLAAVLPMLGVDLPYTKTLIAVTFFAGLLPIIGNLISNTAILLVSLSVSFDVAVGSLVFLVVVHKLEYFLNARIVGSHIKAASWELLCAMLVFEAAFGLPGLVAAPIFYAYIKAELMRLEVI
jgi:predicted PurR-regulated permease PerM